MLPPLPSITPRELFLWAIGRRQPVLIHDNSMLPTLVDGETALLDTRAYEKRPVAINDIVVARDPRDPTRKLIKRVQSISDDGSLFLVGDNPAASTDSRTFGAIPSNKLVGKVTVRWRSVA